MSPRPGQEGSIKAVVVRSGWTFLYSALSTTEHREGDVDIIIKMQRLCLSLLFTQLDDFNNKIITGASFILCCLKDC